MERCPHCDAEIRPGSRFCTQCGKRLPEPAAFAEPWPGPSGSEPNAGWPLPEAVPASLDDARTGVGDAPHVTAEPTDGPIWATAPTPEPTAFAPAIPTWPAPVEVGEQTVEAPAWASPEQAEAAVADAPWRPAGEPEPFAADDSEPDTGEPRPSDDIPSSGVAADETGQPPSFDAAAEPDASETAGSETAGTTPVARAADLIDELRALLPLLAAPADQSAIAARLEAAADADSGRWPALRAAMEDARANPRDVETVVALSRRVDEVIALIDANDRLAAAAREAAAAIRGGLPTDA